MSKKHETFPGEQEEMPERKAEPEIEQPSDPPEQELPDKEIPEVPEELPPRLSWLIWMIFKL